MRTCPVANRTLATADFFFRVDKFFAFINQRLALYEWTPCGPASAQNVSRQFSLYA